MVNGWGGPVGYSVIQNSFDNSYSL
jgi:hypothetical protein